MNPPKAERPKPDHSVGLQYLRGVAAFAVVLHHVGTAQLPKLGYDGYWPHQLQAGVDLFFVLSGFLMWRTTADKSIAPTQFLERRARRIIPLYWLFSLLPLAMSIFTPHLLQSARFDPLHALASFAFLPYPNPSDGYLTPILVPGWTINYEMCFYVLFALCLAAPRSLRLAVTVAVLLLPASVGALIESDHFLLRFYTSPISLEFLFGIVVARLIDSAAIRAISRKQALRLIAVLSVLCPLALLPLPEISNFATARVVTFGIPAAVLLFSVVLIEQCGWASSNRLLLRVGDASYSIYLSQGMVLSAFTQLWRKLPIGNGPLELALFALLSAAASLALGIACFKLLEQPLISTFGRSRRSDKPRADAYRPAAGI